MQGENHVKISDLTNNAISHGAEAINGKIYLKYPFTGEAQHTIRSTINGIVM